MQSERRRCLWTRRQQQQTAVSRESAQNSRPAGWLVGRLAGVVVVGVGVVARVHDHKPPLRQPVGGARLHAVRLPARSSARSLARSMVVVSLARPRRRMAAATAAVVALLGFIPSRRCRRFALAVVWLHDDHDNNNV